MVFKDVRFMAHVFIWIAQICYVLCLVPQIIKNSKNKTVSGLSDLLLFGFLNGYLFILYYLYCLQMPVAYKIMNVFQLLAMLGIVFQRIHYDKTLTYMRFEKLLAGNIAGSFIFIPFAINYPQQVGIIAGWVAVSFFTISYVSQIIKVYFTKSVAGFSFMFISITIFGILFELVAANILSLPAPTHFALWRALLACGIFVVQFQMYGKKDLVSRIEN